jgi:hypothetical protein
MWFVKWLAGLIRGEDSRGTDDAGARAQDDEDEDEDEDAEDEEAPNW